MRKTLLDRLITMCIQNILLLCHHYKIDCATAPSLEFEQIYVFKVRNIGRALLFSTIIMRHVSISF